MPIQYGVPFYPQFAESPLLTTLAKGPQDVVDLGKVFPAYLAGQEAARKNQLQNMFAGGLPKDPNDPTGQTVDYPKVGEMILQQMGPEGLKSALESGLFGLKQKELNRPLPSDEPGLPPVPQATPGPQSSTDQGDLPVSLSRVPTPLNLTSQTITGVRREPVQGNPALFNPQEVQPASFDERFTGAAAEPQTQELSAEQRKTPHIYVPGPGPDEQRSPVGGSIPGQQPLTSGGLAVSEENAQRIAARARLLYDIAERRDAVFGAGAGASLRAQADKLMEQAQGIRKPLEENVTLTPEEKAARSAGRSVLDLQRQQKANEADVKNFQDQVTNIQTQAVNAIPGIQKAELGKQLTQTPGFYSGPFSEQATTYQQFRNLFGVDAAGALPNEAFQKVTNDMLQEQIKAMGQSGVGRVLMSEVAIMRRAIASLSISDVSNRALLEILKRTYQKWNDLADLTRDLPPNSATLNRTVTNYLRQHPMFSADELANPALLGAKEPPPTAARWSPQQLQQWGASQGLKPGDPFMFQGNLRMIPGQ